MELALGVPSRGPRRCRKLHGPQVQTTADDSAPTTRRRNRRGGGRDARRSARSSGNQQVAAPYIVRKIAPVDILSDEGAEIIEDNAETILEEIGIDFRMSKIIP